MPLTGALVPLIRQRQFWAEFFFGDWHDPPGEPSLPERQEYREYPELRGCQVEFWFTDLHALVLGLDEILGRVELSLLTPALQPPGMIAWDDQAHWTPHVLRWDELDLICRCVALIDSTLHHPGLPLLFLHRFAPVCAGDDPTARSLALTLAWRGLGIFTEPEIDHLVRRFDERERGFRWVLDKQLGWTLKADYTMRKRGDEFPFKDFNAALSDAASLQSDLARQSGRPSC